MSSDAKRIKECEKTIKTIESRIKVIQREIKFGRLIEANKTKYQEKLDAAKNDLTKVRAIKRELETKENKK